jgi:hypothetical protein
MRRTASLRTPPLPRIVPDGVFDAFGWCRSDELEWGTPASEALDVATPITSANPPGMVFVLKGERAPFLPRELASLHVTRMGLADEWALAPWGIDDATDLLFSHGAAPGETMWLATGSLAGLVWGLHDWAHFHNHGPFEQRAWTELQCDASALAWAWINREAIGIDEAQWERARGELVAVGAERFAAEGLSFDADRMTAQRVKALAGG